MFQDVTRFAVGIVDHDVEQSDRPELGAGTAEKRQGIEAAIHFDEPLHRARTIGTVADDGLGHDVEPKCFGNAIGEHFAGGQRPGVKIPQRPGTSRGLVDHLLAVR